MKILKNIYDSLGGKVNFSDIVDNLSSTDSGKPLSANQGKQLNDDKASLSDINNDPNFYEQGAWSPKYTTIDGDFESISSGTTISAYYIRIGNMVWVSAFYRTGSIDKTGFTGAESVRIDGLPFVVAGTLGTRAKGAPASFSRFDDFQTDFIPYGVVRFGSDQIQLLKRQTGSTLLSDVVVDDLSIGSNDNELYFTAIYETT